MKGIEGIDPERVTSLATEKNIVGSIDGLEVDYFLQPNVSSQAEADRVRLAVMGLPYMLAAW